MRTRHAFWIGLLLLAPSLRAEPLLTIEAGTGGVVSLTREQFTALPQHRLTTKTPWTEGMHSYQGMLLRDLLNQAGLKTPEVWAVALNDYAASIPREDADRYPVLVAAEQDGAALTVRNKGPLWIIYPLSDFPELDKERYHSRMVWQVKRLEAR
ncbi:molybdopterin-dependent oxidoreductase [Aeromonas schubertii]|uniref:molybdopterin-dependent oxidoreductase n=1 Tax=Aeromonas schubertii TaxID=652 RepID=UPI001CC39E38|nr:molybdopterin-dependent oxidoreductase [Aeromonas schubertii]MBZ6071751.1 molybdopterin-dependent oxidoreductase [Aeromonas schubertii]